MECMLCGRQGVPLPSGEAGGSRSGGPPHPLIYYKTNYQICLVFSARNLTFWGGIRFGRIARGGLLYASTYSVSPLPTR